jgi:hypothetical protein
MTDTYRALCAELLRSLENYPVQPPRDRDLCLRARAALAEQPPSLKEQALQALNDAVKMADDTPPEGICSDQANIIRRALEQLDD